jgi:hypothetical protein
MKWLTGTILNPLSTWSISTLLAPQLLETLVHFLISGIMLSPPLNPSLPIPLVLVEGVMGQTQRPLGLQAYHPRMDTSLPSMNLHFHPYRDHQ